MWDPDSILQLSEAEKLELLDQFSEEEDWDIVPEELVARLAKDESREVRLHAVRALGECWGPEYGGLLVEIGASDAAEEVRLEAVVSLGAYVYHAKMCLDLDAAEYEPIRVFLTDRAKDASSPVLLRACAIESLAYDDSDDVCELIQWAYAHEERALRLSAVTAMGRASMERWTPHIASELYSPDREMRLRAICAATEACVEDATPALRNLAMCDDRDVRLCAIEGLAYTAGPGALETLELCAGDEDPEVQEAAEDAIEVFTSFRQAELNPDSLLEEDEHEEDEDTEQDP